MSVVGVQPGRAQPGGARSGWRSLEGPVARTALVVWFAFLTSVCFLVLLLPYLAFERLVGWQPTHLAVWLGAVSLAPVAPAARGLLGAVHALVEEREHPGRPVGRFFSGIGAASAGLRRAWWAVPVLALLLGYDAAIYGHGTPAVPVLVAVAALAVAVLVVAATVLDVHGSGTQHWWPTVRAAGGLVLRRPLVALAWLVLGVLAVLVSGTPLVGPSLALVVPAAWAGAVDVVARGHAVVGSSGPSPS